VNDVAGAAVYAAGGSVLVAVPALLLLWSMRRRPLTVLIPLTVLLAAVSLAAGILAAELHMAGDAGRPAVLVPSLVVAGALSLVGSLLVARWVRDSGRAISSLLATGEGAVDGPAELRALGADLAQAQVREAALETSRRELVSWVSHDLRTPLAGLRAMAEALEDGVVSDPPTVARYHAQIRGEVDQLSALVDDLFELSRIQAGAVPLTTGMTDLADLADLLQDALASADPLARDRRVRLTGPATDDLPPVDVSSADIGRVLRNLLVNAIHHTPYDGTVAVLAQVEDGAVAVGVQDACGGIPEADLPRVFETAFRGNAARSPGGAGLGLAIARSLVDRHHGEISVANVGSGCRFTVRLPLPAA
jgi:signal transduction histidine kinase